MSLGLLKRNNCFWLDKHTQSLNEVFLWRYQYDNCELPIVEEVRIASAVETSILRRQQWKRHSPPTWKEQEWFSQNSTKQPTFELNKALTIRHQNCIFYGPKMRLFWTLILWRLFTNCVTNCMVIQWVTKLLLGAFWLFWKKSLNLLLIFFTNFEILRNF